MRDAAEIPSVLAAMAAACPREVPTALGKGALAYKKAIVAVAPSRLRNVGRKGAKLGVRYDVSGNEATIKGTGPWPILDKRAKAHTIPRARKGPIAFADGSVRLSVHHPGHAAKDTWKRGMEAGREPATRAMFNVFRDAMVEAFRSG